MLGIVGSTRKTLRVLEARGLIKPARSTGKRRYTQERVRRLWLIELLRDVDVPMNQIVTILTTIDSAPTGGAAATSLHTTLRDLQRRIDGKIKDLELARESLASAAQTLSQRCGACTRPPTACAECATTGRLDVVSALLLTTAGRALDDTSGDT